MIRTMVRTLGTMGAAMTVCVLASGMAVAAQEALYVNGEPHRAGAEPNVCYHLRVQEGDYLENTTGYAATFYNAGGCLSQNAEFELDHDSARTAPKVTSAVMFSPANG